MYLFWLRRSLSPNGCTPPGHPCPHATDRPGRARLVPLVCQAERRAGRPERVVLHRLPSLRVCCLSDPAANEVRARWWAAVDASWSKAPAHVVAVRAWLEAQLAAKVPRSGDQSGHLPEVEPPIATPLPASPVEPAPSSQDAHTAPLPAPPTPEVATVEGEAPPPPPAPPTERVEVPAEVDAPVAPALPECFAVLGLDWPCSAADVRAAWRTKANQGGAAGFVAANKAKGEAEAWLRAHG